MLITIIPVLILVVGLLLWALATHPLAKEIGRLMFACGLMAVVLIVARVQVRIGP